MQPTNSKTRELTDAQRASLQKLLDPVPEADPEPTPSAGGAGGDRKLPPTPPSSGGYDDIESSRKAAKAVLVGGTIAALFLAKSCSWTPTESVQTLGTQFGKWVYVALTAFFVAYFLRLLLKAPLKPDWYRHAEQARETKLALVFVVAIGSVLALVREINTKYGENWQLMETVRSSVIPFILFAAYSLLVRLLSTVKPARHNSFHTVGDPKARPAVRYMLTVLFMCASLLSALLAASRIWEVFGAIPSTWYEVYLPWCWRGGCGA
jgi:hypothetical protein